MIGKFKKNKWPIEFGYDDAYQLGKLLKGELKYKKSICKLSEKMIEKNIRINNEFYVCPVYNEAIKDNKKIIIKEVKKDGMWGIGTPEDLNYFIKNFNQDI